MWSSLISNVPCADAAHGPIIAPAGIVISKVPACPSNVPVIVTRPRIMPGASHVPEIVCPDCISVHDEPPAIPPAPLPISEPVGSDTTAFHVPLADAGATLEADDGAIGVVHAALPSVRATIQSLNDVRLSPCTERPRV